MKKEIKKQIEKEIAKCEQKISWSVHPQHYWIHRKSILMCIINFGPDVAIEDCQKVLDNRKKYLQEVVKAYDVAIVEITTKWAK